MLNDHGKHLCWDYENNSCQVVGPGRTPVLTGLEILQEDGQHLILLGVKFSSDGGARLVEQ